MGKVCFPDTQIAGVKLNAEKAQCWTLLTRGYTTGLGQLM